MARKQSLLHRLDRLKNGQCPIHGTWMGQIDGWYEPDDGKPFTIVGCSRKDCLLSARAYSIDGPFELLTEHLYLLDENAIAEALSAPAKPRSSAREAKVSSSTVFSKTEGKCYYCGCILEIDVNFTIDHVVPRISGGSNRSENLVPCCKSCNSSKGDRSVEEFRFFRSMQSFKVKSGVTFTKLQIQYLRTMGFELDLPNYEFWFERHMF